MILLINYFIQGGEPDAAAQVQVQGAGGQQDWAVGPGRDGRGRRPHEGSLG